jgi:UPF0755 protein
VSESKPPPNGRDPKGSDQPPATARVTPKLVRASVTTDRKLARQKPGQSEETPRPPSVVAAIPSTKSASIVPNARTSISGDARTSRRSTDRLSRAKAETPATVPVAGNVAPRAAIRVGGNASEPYPALSGAGRPVNGNGASPGAAKNSQLFAPRSPRTALEPDTVDMPTPRSKSARHPFVVVGNAIISIFILLAVASGIALVAGKQRFDAPGPLADDRVVNIPRGVGIRDIADVLVREGVIDQSWVFVGGVFVLKAREDLKAGEYQFKAHASLRDVVATIVDGRVVMHPFTMPEGLTSEQIVERLMDDDVLTGNVKEMPREGSLLPDTYNFARGMTREQMIQHMQQAQQRVVKEIWDHHAADLPIKSADQLVILASIIEKETGKAEERTRVAAVFINRLKQKMRLQSDPTIIYGLVGGKGTLGRPIMKSEIDQPTPYNTYQIDGLPPGPITNPGRASLEAVANPARTRELYFVADGTGGHLFAETYEQHQKNVARLRQIESDQKDQANADTQAAAPAAQTPASPAAPQTPPSPPAAARRASSHHNANTQTTTH